MSKAFARAIKFLLLLWKEMKKTADAKRREYRFEVSDKSF